MRLRGTAVTIALLAGSLTFSAAGTAKACGGSMSRSAAFALMRDGGLETITARTFYIEAKLPKTVAIGDIAKIKVTVTRPADEDPAGNGIPTPRPTTMPAADAIVGIGLHIGPVFLPGAAITDEEGKATVKIKIESYAPANTLVDASAYAWRVALTLPCATVQEDGYRTYPRALRTTR